jgi:hypothetical protein
MPSAQLVALAEHWPEPVSSCPAPQQRAPFASSPGGQRAGTRRSLSAKRTMIAIDATAATAAAKA